MLGHWDGQGEAGAVIIALVLDTESQFLGEVLVIVL